MIDLKFLIDEAQCMLQDFEGVRSDFRAGQINLVFYDIFHWRGGVDYQLPIDPVDLKDLKQIVTRWKQLRPTDPQAIDWCNIMRSKLFVKGIEFPC
jgi:hypothetical protein